MAGQTNDEPYHLYDDGNADVVLRLEGSDAAGADMPTALTVTHPGMTAFKGKYADRTVAFLLKSLHRYEQLWARHVHQCN